MEDNDDYDGGVDRDNCDMMLVAKLRSRLYYEKSCVYRGLGDSKSQSAALKYSLRLHYNSVVSKIYCQEFSVKIEAPLDNTAQHLVTDITSNSNVCLSFIQDFDTINLLKSSQLSSDL